MRRLVIAACLCCLAGSGLAAPAARPAPAAVLTFERDSEVPREDPQPLIEPLVARTLAASGNWVSLEAHTDDHGSRELNLALGQRRLDALERELALKGVPIQHIRCINHGEEAAERGIRPDPRIEIRIEKIGY
ncbi:peptidoglycan-associated lipoprotein [Sulfurisoma sediminicola]|uniref:Peptidoglycan-associated lipoprotein n=2 Tax=Sulfurisoma sediminicola TaxID=1381557 RepID=A0A497XIK7_9PROT|nr:peptidoglycan-associated lipoprotein [Sulfurisoma sediminicola]